MNVIDEIPEPHRSTLVAVLEDRTPELLAELRSNPEPVYRQWEAVGRTMRRAMSEHFLPGHEVDEVGVAIDNALGAFYLRWPNDELPDYPYA